MSNVFSFEPASRQLTNPSRRQSEVAMLQGVALTHDNLILNVEEAALRLRDSMAARASETSIEALTELAARYQQFISELRTLRPLIEKALED